MRQQSCVTSSVTGIGKHKVFSSIQPIPLLQLPLQFDLPCIHKVPVFVHFRKLGCGRRSECERHADAGIGTQKRYK